MKIFFKAIKVLVAFTVLSLLFLFSPFTLIFNKTETSSSAEGFSVDGEALMSTVTKDIQEDNVKETESSCSSCQSLDLNSEDEKIEQTESLIESNTATEDNSVMYEACTIKKEIINDDYQIYEQEGKVYIVFYGNPTNNILRKAYKDLRDQDCLSTSPNLIVEYR